jgi:hypothetical protein
MADDELPQLFRQLEDRWRAAGVPVHEHTGLAGDVVDEALRGLGLPASEDLRTWFAWRNPAPDAPPVERGLGGDCMEFLRLENAVFYTKTMREVAAESAASSDPYAVASAGGWWPSTAFAIATDGGGSTLSVSLDHTPDRPPVYINYFETDRLGLASDLRGLMRRWIAQLDARVQIFSGSLWYPQEPGL